MSLTKTEHATYSITTANRMLKAPATPLMLKEEKPKMAIPIPAIKKNTATNLYFMIYSFTYAVLSEFGGYFII